MLGRGDTYRAVAVDAGKELKAVATVPARAADQWQTQLSSGSRRQRVAKAMGTAYRRLRRRRTVVRGPPQGECGAKQGSIVAHHVAGVRRHGCPGVDKRQA